MAQKEISRHIEKIVDYVSGNKCDDSRNVPLPILASWERSLENYQIDPSKDDPVQILTANELREYTGPIENFLRIAKVGVQHLHRQVADLGYSTLLCDANGVTVDWLGNERFSQQWKEAGLYLGAMWNENQEGTCGVGTALTEQIPLTVHKDEHFRARNIDLTCSCAPIIGPDNKTMGLLDISALHSPQSKDSQALALQLAMQSARMIELAYFLNRYADQWVLRLNHARELAEVSSECLIALNGEGKILAADWVARRVLRHEVGGGNLVGCTVCEVFDLDFEKLLDITRRSNVVLPLVTQKAKLRLFASLRCPQAVSSNSTRSVAEKMTEKQKPSRPDHIFTLDYLAGSAPELIENVQRIKRVMNKSLPILICGETGTGKEMFAKAIHNASRHAKKPFVAVNCAAIPESLIESELFGYKQGAFTGANRKGMRGKILQSDGGTLFLDEIGDMPASLQPRLLRVLAEREVTPLGSETPIPVDLHVVCATHRNIMSMVESGKFREDLFYRLNSVTMELPPLRLRPDIRGLISEILALEAESGSETISLDAEAMQALSDFPWPGNIRQLRNALRYALALNDNGMISCADLPEEIGKATKTGPIKQSPARESSPAPVFPATNHGSPPRLSAKEHAEYQRILDALQKHKWQVTKAVKDVGISRATIYRKMDKYCIIPPNNR